MGNKHIIFLVHGMGDHDKKWADDASKLLKDNFDAIPQLGYLPFDERFIIKPLSYNKETFEAVRTQWKEERGKLSAALNTLNITAGAFSTLDRLAKTTEKDSFLNTHVLDVLLYRFVPQIGAWARDTIRKQILDTLVSQQDDVYRWSVIAHSLGTAVTHDALHELYTDNVLFKGKNVSLMNVTRPQAIVMVANVSRVLQTFKKAYESLVRPGAPDVGNICRRYLNVWHEWDPFPQPRKFRPTDTWPSNAVRELGLYEDIKICAIKQKNVHSFEHYLANPRAHIPIFEALIDQKVVPQEMHDSRFAEYASTLPINQIDKLTKELKSFQIGEEESWHSRVKKWRKFL